MSFWSRRICGHVHVRLREWKIFPSSMITSSGDMRLNIRLQARWYPRGSITILPCPLLCFTVLKRGMFPFLRMLLRFEAISFGSSPSTCILVFRKRIRSTFRCPLSHISSMNRVVWLGVRLPKRSLMFL